MENKRLYKFIDEIEQQCRFAEFAFQQLNNSLNEQNSQAVFFHTHAFLGHVATLNRLFWPKRQNSLPRGDNLRKELDLADSSALNINTLRNQIELSDETFEDWLNGLPNPEYVDTNLMPAGTISGFNTDTFHRSLDPDTFKFTYRGATCELRPAHDAIRDLRTVIDRWKRTHNPW